MQRLLPILVLIAVALCPISVLDAKEPTISDVSAIALENYVTKPDNSYGWTKRREGRLGSGSYVELTLTSQTWRDVLWKHQLFIYRPSVVARQAQAMLLIAGGDWDESLAKPPASGNEKLPTEAHIVAAMAESMHAPVAVLLQVPQQPMFEGMVEDEIISFTFAKFFETGDAEWPLLLPMVKSTVRAMDAVQEFAGEQWHLDIEHFLVTGASKRGWTTWLTAAVDSRVNGLAPIVINMLNMVPHMELQERSFGGFSNQISDYTDKGLQNRLNTERGAALRAIVDPYSYRRQLRQPKLVILGTNDAYWPVDALSLYWDELEGEKHIVYVPNGGHGLRDHPRILGTVAAFYQSLTNGKPLPKLAWQFTDDDDRVQLHISADVNPLSVTAWSAMADTRDFRKAHWTSHPAKPNGESSREFVIDLKKPQSGYAAMFAEAKFDGQSMPFYLSSQLRVIPANEPQEPIKH
jgi:PhoPQ-activated pathogenicity-related protein